MNQPPSQETIFALSTAQGRAGVAVIRVSGPQAWESAKRLTKKDLIARKALYAALIHPSGGDIIDQALVLGFAGPASFTGEDVVEYHVHGSRAVINELMEVLGAQEGYRMAEPGEFTRRAFENGKMDLTEAEAVADLIDAETQAQKIQALAQMGGALSILYNGWTEQLKKALAHLEADIEFPDEDLPDGIAPEITDSLAQLQNAIADHLNDNRRGERLRDGIQVAVIGAPNAGKSSLINALAQRDVAIVSDIAGTTRDVIEVHLDIGGYPVILSDTAGLRPDQIGQAGQDLIESEGIKRALQRAQDADIKLLLFDGSTDQADSHTLELIDDKAIIAINKLDCHPEGAQRLKDLDVYNQILRFVQDDKVVGLSVKSGAGIENLIKLLVERVNDMFVSRESISLTRQRHRTALEECMISLQRGLSADLPELMAEDTRLAIRALGRITGKVDVEDLLDVIFKDFCIGK